MQAILPMLLPAVLLVTACTQQQPSDAKPIVEAARAESSAIVRPGIEAFMAELPARLRGMRVGLITNASAVDRAGTPVIDLIARHPQLKLVALLAAEHGIRGDVAAGARIDDGRDAKTGVPIYSLYKSEDQGPTPAMLQDVDVLVYDLIEVGGRTWTYVSTMALSMQAAKRKGIPFVVLDRPNPIGGEIVEGALIEPGFTSFVGMYPIPARHGMTVGELATLFNTKHEIGADLIVVKAANWRRAQWMDDTGLPWTNPSPNLRSLAALNSYPGTVYFEGTNLSEGRGTDRPFEQIGAPYLNAPEIARVMNERALPGVRFEPVTLSVLPTARKYPGQTIPGLRFVITDRQAYRPVRTALLLIDAIRRRHPNEFQWTGDDRPPDGVGQGSWCDRGRHAPGAARRVGPRGGAVARLADAVPPLPVSRPVHLPAFRQAIADERVCNTIDYEFSALAKLRIGGGVNALSWTTPIVAPPPDPPARPCGWEPSMQAS